MLLYGWVLFSAFTEDPNSVLKMIEKYFIADSPVFSPQRLPAVALHRETFLELFVFKCYEELEAAFCFDEASFQLSSNSNPFDFSLQGCLEILEDFLGTELINAAPRTNC